MDEIEEGPGFFAQMTTQEKRQFRSEQQEQAKRRKLSKPLGSLLQQAKQIWSELRLKALEKQKRTELMARMMELITGKIEDMVLKHDASRIIQCCLKYGTLEQRNVIAQELKNHYLTLSKSQYGKFIVSKILNFCPDFRTAVISSFYGKVVQMIKHRDASLVLEEAYSQFANSKQKLMLFQEFYGPEYALFKSSKTFDEIVAESPEKRSILLKNLKENITSLLEKAQVSIGPHSIVHKLLLEYLTSESDKEVLDLLLDHLVEILHTREGSQVAQIVVAKATAKDRKQILKSFKGFVSKIAAEQYGHAVLISCFECIDDTVLVGKLLTELDFDELLKNKYAIRVFLFLLCGRKAKYQPAYLIRELQEFDKIANYKKNWELKQTELLEQIQSLLIDACTRQIKFVLRDKESCQLLIELFKNTSVTKDALIDAIVSECQLEQSEPLQEFHAIKKLKKEADELKQSLIPGMDEHVLVNRNSTMCLKNLLNPRCEVEYNVKRLATGIWGNVSGNLSYWADYIAKNSESSGTVFVFVALVECGEITDAKELIVSEFQGKSLKTKGIEILLK